jgi:putative dimethyl sulfoxide reductase chaperone
VTGAASVDTDAVACRAQMYRFLSEIYLQPPGRDLVRLLSEGDFLDQLADLFERTIVAELAAGVTTAEPEHTLARLGQDYMDLFAVPTGRYVMPFEDVYRSEPADGQRPCGPLLGARAIAVRRIYREAGAEVDRQCRELPTHIGVELAFMNFLCESEATAEEDSGMADTMRALQQKFLRQHLDRWVPQLCRAIRSHAATPFYRGIASLTEAFVAQDAAIFDVDAGDRGNNASFYAGGGSG